MMSLSSLHLPKMLRSIIFIFFLLGLTYSCKSTHRVVTLGKYFLFFLKSFLTPLLFTILLNIFLFLFLEEPSRSEDDLKCPYIEKCRVFLADYAKTIMTNYIINVTHSAMFNPSGQVVLFEHKGLRYAYEIPCDPISPMRYSVDPRKKNNVSWNVNYEWCLSIHRLLINDADQYLHPSYNGKYYGPYGECCYSNDHSSLFPSPVKTTGEFLKYRIRAEKFYINTPQGRIFQSPTLSDYFRFVQKRMPYFHSSVEPDYLYDYWE